MPPKQLYVHKPNHHSVYPIVHRSSTSLSQQTSIEEPNSVEPPYDAPLDAQIHTLTLP